jgi:hypothetical protein
MKFDDWLGAKENEHGSAAITLAEAAWDFQQAKLDAAIEALEYYRDNSAMNDKAACALMEIK